MGGAIVRGGFVEGSSQEMGTARCVCIGWLWRVESFVAMFERCRQYRPRRWMGSHHT